MKGLISKLSVVLAVVVIFANVNLLAKDNKVELSTNITCQGCVNTIKTAFKGVEGVKDVSANIDAKVVTVNFDDEKISSDKIKSTIADAGYTAKDMKSCDNKDMKSCDNKDKKSCEGKDPKSCDDKAKKECSGSGDKCCKDKKK